MRQLGTPKVLWYGSDMKRSLQCALGAAAVLASSSASAQTYGSAGFGTKHQLVISAERLFGFYHDSASVTTNNVETTVKTDSFSLLSSPVALSGQSIWSYSSPRMAGDFFIVDHFSVGASLGYSHISLSRPVGPNMSFSTSGDSWLFAPRVGYSYMFSDLIGIWPRAGFTYRTLSAGNLSAHDLALTLEVPFVFTVIPHVVFWGGPTLDLGLSGSQDTPVGAFTQTQDFNATEVGIQTALAVYFDL